jgi:tagaturonate epimerase
MTLSSISSLPIVQGSLVAAGGAEWALADSPGGARLLVAVGSRDPRPAWLAELDAQASDCGQALLLTAPTSARNAAVLRAQLPWLRPSPIGLRTSAGMGDRLGLATPGHVRAVRAAGGSLVPIFAQQSIREMTRTGRSPQEVLDAATWGAFRAGWQGQVGADADHLKSLADADACLAAGFTLFTVDPGEHVEDVNRPAGELRAAFGALPWHDFEDSEKAATARYVGRSFDVDGHRIAFDAQTLAAAAVKYGRAVLHVTRFYRHLYASASGAFELEVSVDETDAPTSHAEHLWIALELRRLGVQWVSLAPRFVGRFEKGVDYQGDTDAFDRDCAVHAAIARAFGPYKLSLHSGSDKFSIYGSVARHTRGLVHVKTAGTSYLEALRTLASAAPALFRAIYALARERYDVDRASYHVSAEVCRTPPPDHVGDAELTSLLDDFDARQVLHVTFGSVVSAKAADGSWLFRDRIHAALCDHAAEYEENLERHFVKHLAPFAAATE